jgi:hypothetical protein
MDNEQITQRLALFIKTLTEIKADVPKWQTENHTMYKAHWETLGKSLAGKIEDYTLEIAVFKDRNNHGVILDFEGRVRGITEALEAMENIFFDGCA